MIIKYQGNMPEIHSGCFVADNATIIGNVKLTNTMVIGSTGKITRELSEDEILSLRATARHYVELASKYKKK